MLALGEQRIGPQEAARRLNVEYVASGSVTRRWGRLVVAVELIEATSGRILWSEDFDRREQDVFTVIEDVGNQIVAAIANEIEAVERNARDSVLLSRSMRDRPTTAACGTCIGLHGPKTTRPEAFSRRRRG
jgi:hypothetical protein